MVFTVFDAFRFIIYNNLKFVHKIESCDIMERPRQNWSGFLIITLVSDEVISKILFVGQINEK